MIITCASCLTKFHLDDSKISDKGTKVRCSRCQHVFYVTRPPETKEEVIEDLESFAKYHEELMEPSQKEMKIPAPLKAEEKEAIPEGAPPLFSERIHAGREDKVSAAEFEVKERTEAKVTKPKSMVRKERRLPSLLFIILVILILSVFGLFYLWTESGVRGAPYRFLGYPIQKIPSFWKQIWGSEKEGLILRDLYRYEEQIGEVPLFVIEGKVDNQSRVIKKHIKIKVAIFDQKKAKLAEKGAVCGRIISREELKNLPETFLEGEMMIRPKTEKDMITPPGKTIPFMVIFRNLSTEAKEFQVEIIEAPTL